MRIRAYQPESDEDTLLGLWAAAFGETWSMTAEWLRRETSAATYLPGDHLLAEIDGQAAGFALTQLGTGDSPRGSLLALAVRPDLRRRGVGQALHQAALFWLYASGARQVQLGAGGLGYFWPGVPAGLDGAWAFFNALGWAEIERSYDLVCSRDGYTTPAWVWERVKGLGFRDRRAGG